MYPSPALGFHQVFHRILLCLVLPFDRANIFSRKGFAGLSNFVHERGILPKSFPLAVFEYGLPRGIPANTNTNIVKLANWPFFIPNLKASSFEAPKPGTCRLSGVAERDKEEHCRKPI